MSRAIDVVKQFFAAFDGDDPDRVVEVLSPCVQASHNALLGTDCDGRDEYRDRLPAFLDAFQSRHYDVDDFVTEQREGATEVVARYRFTAIYRGAPVELPGVMWLTVCDGLITRRVDTFDSLLFLRQTGQVMPSGQP